MSRLRQVTLFGAPPLKQPRADADPVITGVSCTSGCSVSSLKSGFHNQVPRPQVSELEVCNIIDNTVSANDQQSVHVTNYIAEWVSVPPSLPYICHSSILINSSSDEDPGTFSGESACMRLRAIYMTMVLPYPPALLLVLYLQLYSSLHRHF